jgi:hypothetical protein
MATDAPSDEQQADRLYASAKQHFHAGRAVEAERDYRAAIALAPRHPAAEGLALLLFCQMRGEEASSLLVDHFSEEFGPIPDDDLSVPREFLAAAGTARMVADGLRVHGAVLLRKLYSIPALAKLAPKFNLTPDRWGKPTFRLGIVPAEEIESALIPPLLRELVPMMELDLTTWPMASWVRVAIPSMPGTQVPFHQDMLVCTRKCMNVWIPIDPCGAGTQSPGLELVARQLPSLLPTRGGNDNEYAIQHMEIDEETVRTRVPAEWLWRPRFALGDALLFLGTTVHRTSVESGMDKLRTSIELRFFNPPAGRG